MNEVQVVWACVPSSWLGGLADGCFEGARDMLDEHEDAAMARFRRPLDQARYAAAHVLVRRVLAERLGADPGDLRFTRTCACGQEHAKPALREGGLEFSLTHTGTLVGVAVSRAPVGLDAEAAWELGREQNLAQMVRGPSDDPMLALRELWVTKEALLKAAGVGLTVAMPALGIGPHLNLRFTGSACDLGIRPWWVRPVAAPTGFAAAVAGEGSFAPEITVEQRELV